MKEKAAVILTKLFGAGLFGCLAWAMVIGLLFFVSFVAGGDVAEAFGGFIKNFMMPVLYITGTVTVVIGIIRMYVKGEKEFVFDPKPKKN